MSPLWLVSRATSLLDCRRSSLERRTLVANHLRLAQTTDRGARSGRGACGDAPAASRDLLAAGLGLALPEASRAALDALLAAEAAEVPGALLDLVALHDLPQRRTIAGTVLTGDADLLGVL